MNKISNFIETKLQRFFCTGTPMAKLAHIQNDVIDSAVFDAGVKQANKSDHQQHKSHHIDHFIHEQSSDHELSIVQRIFRDYYGTYLFHPIAKFFVCVLFIVYLATAIYGSCALPNGLQPEKLVSKDHYVYYFLWSDRFWKTGMPMQILVNSPHNISIYETRQQVFAMVRSFEDTDHTMNSNSTMFFLREYTMWLEERGFKDSPNTTQYSGYNIKYWLRATGSRTFWESQIQWGNESLGQDPYEIIAFRFTVGLKNFALPPDHEDAVVLIRSIGNNHSQFNITCFQQQSPFVDQYLTINNTTIRNTVLSLAIMIFIALLLIPHPICGIFMAFSVISIDVGVSGYLYYWGVNMDCISMITMIMATGFAVDLSAHVSYAYVRAEGTSNERAMKSLETLGWPVFQGVTSTLLGVLVMGTIDAYIISTFFKTVVIVIVFGLMHSIIFLPVALTMFVRDNVDCCRKFRSQKRVGAIFSSPINNNNGAQSETDQPKSVENNTKKSGELEDDRKEDHNTSIM